MQLQQSWRTQRSKAGLTCTSTLAMSLRFDVAWVSDVVTRFCFHTHVMIICSDNLFPLFLTHRSQGADVTNSLGVSQAMHAGSRRIHTSVFTSISAATDAQATLISDVDLLILNYHSPQSVAMVANNSKSWMLYNQVCEGMLVSLESDFSAIDPFPENSSHILS